jgi:peptidoglycan/LPS O-acetylase OafA/YrhL
MNTEPSAWRNPRLSIRIPELDGVRGLAILLMLVFNYFASGQSQTIAPWYAKALIPFRLSWSGVDLFFVLSGFLIGGILYDVKNARSYYKAFYLQRACRVFPLYFLWLAIYVAGMRLVNPGTAAPLRALFAPGIHVWAYPLFLQDFFIAFRHNWGARWMTPTWPIAVGVHLYLLLPFFIRNLSYKGIVRLTLGGLLLAPAIRIAFVLRGNIFDAPSAFPLCRADELCFGVLLALVCRDQRAWGWLVSHRGYIVGAFAALAMGVVILTIDPAARLTSTVGYSWLAAFYASLLLLVIAEPGRVAQRIFGNRVLRGLGTYAYALYIMHAGVNGLWHAALRGEGRQVHDLFSLCITIFSIVTAVALAAISWRFLEAPLMRRAHAKYRYLT